MLTACYLTSGAVVSTAKEMVSTAKQDAWFCFYLPMLYAMGIILVFIWLFRRYQEDNLFSLARKLLGTTGGTIVNALLFVYLLHVLCLDLRELSEFVRTILLIRTPLMIIMFSIILITAYLARSGIEVLARLGHFYFFFLSITLASLPILVLNEIEVTNLLPPLPKGLAPVLHGSLLPMGPFGEILVFGALFLNFSRDDKGPAIHPLIRGVIFSAFLLTLLTATMVTAAGTSIIGKTVYPSLVLVQLIHITDFLDRLDIVLVSLWIPAFVIKICVTYYILCQCLGYIGPRTRDGLPFVFVLMPLVLLISLLSFDSVIDLLHFEMYVWPLLTVLHEALLLLVLALFRWIRSRREVTA